MKNTDNKFRWQLTQLIIHGCVGNGNPTVSKTVDTGSTPVSRAIPVRVLE